MDYTIERLGHQGDGIAEGPVYAPLTLPGEVVSGTLEGQKLTDVRIVTLLSHAAALRSRQDGPRKARRSVFMHAVLT